jgi:hypothetical protein
MAARRRAASRARQRHVRDLERLARLAPGGSPERPIEIDTPPLVEVMATAARCPLCAGTYRLDEHAAETIAGARLRIAHVTCTQCGIGRAIHFRLRQLQ